jgi:signal transduction histidine kinase
MPWKGLNMIPEDMTIEWRLSYMQSMLRASVMVAHTSFIVLSGSFTALVVYLTLLYQQRQKRVRENRMLVMKNLEIARRNEFIRYVSATIGHEFKNNLGRIKRRLDLAEVPPEVRAQIDSNLHKLFADIDIFKKISEERESVLIGFQKLNPLSMLEELSGHYTDMAVFHFEGGVSTPAIFASAELLRSVFEILIDNAIKYKKPGQPRAIIRVSCHTDEDSRRKYVALAVRDEGIGMDEPAADRCFYKGSGGSSHEGWGQGLYFAKYVVGLHAGRIRVGKGYTAPGRGTEIIVNLPHVEESLDV